MEHSAKEKEVFDFFTDAVGEIQVPFLASGCEGYVGVRVQMILAFTFAEILSNFWDCYINGGGQSRGPEDKVKEWFNAYCATNRNKFYKTGPYFKKLGIQPLLDLRNSLVHFFGMSPQKSGKHIVLGSSHMDVITFEKYKKGFGADVAVLKPIEFYQLFKEGGLLMMEKMLENVRLSATNEDKKWEHVEGIDRIFKKFMVEGAVQLKIPHS